MKQKKQATTWDACFFVREISPCLCFQVYLLEELVTVVLNVCVEVESVEDAV